MLYCIQYVLSGSPHELLGQIPGSQSSIWRRSHQGWLVDLVEITPGSVHENFALDPLDEQVVHVAVHVFIIFSTNLDR